MTTQNTPFITDSELEAYLKYPPGAIGNPLSHMAIDAACQAVVDYLERPVNITEETIRVSGYDSDLLYLPLSPIVSVSAVSEDDVLLEDSEWELHVSEQTLERVDTNWSPGKRNIDVTLVYGFDPVVSPIKLVALQLASRLYELGPFTSETVGGSTAQMIGGATLTEDEERMIYRWKKLPWL